MLIDFTANFTLDYITSYTTKTTVEVALRKQKLAVENLINWFEHNRKEAYLSSFFLIVSDTKINSVSVEEVGEGFEVGVG